MRVSTQNRARYPQMDYIYKLCYNIKILRVRRRMMKKSILVFTLGVTMIVSLWAAFVMASFAGFEAANPDFQIVLPGDGYLCSHRAKAIHIGPMFVSLDKGESAIREPGLFLPQTFSASGNTISIWINNFDLGFGIIQGKNCMRIPSGIRPDTQTTMNCPTLRGFVFSCISSHPIRLTRSILL